MTETQVVYVVFLIFVLTFIFLFTVIGWKKTKGLRKDMWRRIRSSRGKRKTIRLLKRWVRWKASVAKRPKGVEVEYRWIGLRNGYQLWVEEWWTVLGEKIFKRNRCMEYSVAGETRIESYLDILVYGAVPAEGCETPEELDLYLSNRGF